MAANPELRAQVESAIADNPVLLFMKGTPDAPQCGFSMRTVGVLEQVGVEYGAIDVLPMLQPLREVTSEIADWQTFPQLYVKGELVGGCDIVEEMFEAGELADLLGTEQPESAGAASEQSGEESPNRSGGNDGEPYQSPPMQIEN
ncbi:MAG TPA: Grx4 family monothiol glutaredoxin [Solirubrobacterales bacterium]|nr:Grx4 family monothiol glutaredoxin [Solirubrobacterales bacterium]